MPKIIGISGAATCGKDTLARILKSKLPNSKIYSLAFHLRTETEEYLKKHGHNVWSQNREEKEKFRNYLVEYAEIARQATKGKYFWNLLDQAICFSDQKFIIVSDVRFDEFPEDEVFWVKKSGVLIHIDAWRNGIRILPANYKEEQNEGKLVAKADYILNWEHSGDSDEEIYSQNMQEIDKILELCLNKD